jgi:serine/threonine-protein kinase
MDPASMSFPSDQYSLGCILYYCITGQYPFPGNNAVEKMMAHQTKQPRPIRELVPDCPDELLEIINKLMAKDPNARFSSMGEVASALRPHAMIIPALAQAATAGSRAGKRGAGVVPAGRQPVAVPPVSYDEPDDEPVYEAPPAIIPAGGRTGGQRGGSQYARPTPQPISGTSDTVADEKYSPSASGFNSLRESMPPDPRLQNRSAVNNGVPVPPMGYPTVYQPPPAQGISMVTLVIIIMVSIIMAMGVSIGGMVLLIKSGIIKLGG